MLLIRYSLHHFFIKKRRWSFSRVGMHVDYFWNWSWT